MRRPRAPVSTTSRLVARGSWLTARPSIMLATPRQEPMKMPLTQRKTDIPNFRQFNDLGRPGVGGKPWESRPAYSFEGTQTPRASSSRDCRLAPRCRYRNSIALAQE